MGAGGQGRGAGPLPRWFGRSIARQAGLSAALGAGAVAAALLVTVAVLDPSGGVRPAHLLAALVSVVASAALAYAVSSRHVVPLREVAEAARCAGPPGRLDAIQVHGDDELAVAIRALNDLLGRLRQAAQAQAEEEARLRRLAEGRLGLVQRALEQSAEAICIAAEDGQVLFANDAAARLVGMDRGAELAGRPIQQVDPELPPATWEALWVELGARRAVRRELVRTGPRGITTFECVIGLATIDGQDYAVLTSRDVTEQRRAEAGQRLAAVGTLAAGVAHEVNNPLASLLANGHFALERLRAAPTGGGGAAGPVLLERRDLDELAAALEDSQRAGQRVREVVAGLHLFATPTGKARRPVDPRAELEAALSLAENDLRHRARVVRRLGEVPPVEAGSHQLAQVFLNLLLNAAEALRDGRPERNAVEVATYTGPGGQAVVEIRDDGPGIPAAALHQVFDPFFTTKTVGKGAGLGLSICHGVVRSLGGDVQVESAPGRGACFRILLPAAQRPLPAPDLTPEPLSLAAPRRRVLVIDDDPIVLRALARALRQHEVTGLTSARDAMERFGSGQRWDVVLCDLMMPDVDGIDLHAALHRTAPDQAARFVVVTGGAVTERARAFLARPEVRRILKPVEPGVLLATVDAVAKGSGAARA